MSNKKNKEARRQHSGRQEYKQDEWGSADAYQLAAETGLSGLFDWLKSCGSSWRLGSGTDGRFTKKDVRSWISKLEAGEDLGFGEVPEGLLPIPAPVIEEIEEVVVETSPPTIEPEVVVEAGVAEEQPTKPDRWTSVVNFFRTLFGREKFASDEAKKLADERAADFGVTRHDLLAIARRRGFGPSSEEGWTVEDINKVSAALEPELAEFAPEVEARFTAKGLEAAKALAEEYVISLGQIADHCVGLGAADGQITYLHVAELEAAWDADDAAAEKGPGLWQRFAAVMTKERHLQKFRFPKVQIPDRVPWKVVGATVVVFLLVILAIAAIHPQGLLHQSALQLAEQMTSTETGAVTATPAPKTPAPTATPPTTGQRLADLQVENFDLQDKVTELEEELEATKAAYVAMRADRDRLDAEKAVLNAGFDNVTDAYKKVAQERDQFVNEKAALQDQTAALESEKASLEDRVEALVEQVSGLKTEKSAAKDRITELESEKTALEGQVRAFETAYFEAAKERDRLAGDLAEIASVTIEGDDTLWDLAIQKLGFAPTWDQIIAFAEAAGLPWWTDDGGTSDDASDDLLIVYIQPGEIYDLAAMPCG